MGIIRFILIDEFEWFVRSGGSYTFKSCTGWQCDRRVGSNTYDYSRKKIPKKKAQGKR